MVPSSFPEEIQHRHPVTPLFYYTIACQKVTSPTIDLVVEMGPYNERGLSTAIA